MLYICWMGFLHIHVLKLFSLMVSIVKIRFVKDYRVLETSISYLSYVSGKPSIF